MQFFFIVQLLVWNKLVNHGHFILLLLCTTNRRLDSNERHCHFPQNKEFTAKKNFTIGNESNTSIKSKCVLIQCKRSRLLFTGPLSITFYCLQTIKKVEAIHSFFFLLIRHFAFSFTDRHLAWNKSASHGGGTGDVRQLVSSCLQIDDLLQISTCTKYWSVN